MTETMNEPTVWKWYTSVSEKTSYNMLFQMTLQKVLLGVEIIFGDLFFIIIIF